MTLIDPSLRSSPPGPPPGLTGLVAGWVARAPNAVAVIGGTDSLSYKELWQRAGRLAAQLQVLGVRPDVPVAIAAGRSLDWPIAVLAVLRAGGGYVPIDPNYPTDRVAFMLSDCGAKVLLVQDDIAPRLPPNALTSLRIADSRPDAEPTADATNDDHLGYVIYTSGSTGKPKGVAMPRGPLRWLIEWQVTASSAGRGDVTLQFASPSFDVSFQELFATLASCGTLALIREELRHDPAALLRFCIERNVSRMFLPPVMLQQLAEAGDPPPTLVEVIVAGEALQVTPAVRSFFAKRPGATLHNHYGPSETHVVTAHVLNGNPETWPDLPPIGVPLPHVCVKIDDSGELWLGGDCLARGYVGRPDLTAERFVKGYYRTGDLAKRLAGGALEFLGRADSQIKIRGFRVEPGEVEATLRDHPGIREAVVIAREDVPGVRQLVAYSVPRGDALPPADALRSFVAERLPEYMVPAAFVTLDRLPLSPNGKIDRRNLPAPERRRPDLTTAFAEPATPTERLVAGVWRDVLGLDRVGRDDGFFDLGGTSLAVMHVHTKLRDAIGSAFPVALLFQHSTPRELARALAPSPQTPSVATGGKIAARAPVAVVGFAGRFPGATDVATFWRNLCDGVESITRFTHLELCEAGVPDDLLANPDYVPARGVLPEADHFDAAFFGYNRREAQLLDPQHRLFLEASWAALEHAGHDPARVRGSVGVFAGASFGTYLVHNVCSQPGATAALAQYQSGGFPALFGNDKDYLPTRVSYELNLRGPSVSVQTGCSTSLVAIAQAVDALRVGRCDLALAGGVSVTFPQTRGYLHVEGAMVSPDGHCRAFDADAAGTVFGEGVGVVVLKRLDDALADGDTVYAVVRGVGLSNDGSGKLSFTAPSAEGQAAAIRQALDEADVDARSVGYVEAHGTGTPLGDPIELQGLTLAFRDHTADSDFCRLGSLKPNVGHLEAAAGVAGFLKAALALHHETLPPTLHFHTPNPRGDWIGSPFRVVSERTDWPRGPTPRRAGVNSLGVGGTNAHAILEEAPPQPPAKPSRPEQLFVLSAKTATALDTATRNLADALDKGDLPLADAAWTLQVGRQSFAQRRFAVASDASQLADSSRWVTATHAGAVPNVAFLFPGQGAQRAGMARGLYEFEPVVREWIDRAADVLRDEGIDLHTALTDEVKLRETAVTQPALFAVEYAVAQLWRSWGVEPAAMCGHSIGEYVAATLADVFDFADALRLVALRGRLLQSTPPGAMLAVRLSEADLTPQLWPAVEISAVNGPRQCVVAGPLRAIEKLQRDLEANDIVCRALVTSHAFHCEAVAPIMAAFADAVAKVRRAPPTTPFVSCVSGTWITPEEATDPQYWARHLRRPVRFADGLTTLAAHGPVLLEVGPSTTLTKLAKQQGVGPAVATDAADIAGMFDALGRLWLAGVDVDWAKVHGEAKRRRVALPTYPFERQRYFLEPPRQESAPGAMLAALGKQHDEGPMPSLPKAASMAPDGAGKLPELRTLFAELTGTAADKLDPAASFFELGFDSLALTQAVLAVQNRFGVKVAFRQLLADLPTINALAQHLEAAPVVKREALLIGTEQPQGFGALAPLDRATESELSSRQHDFIARFVERYATKTAGSKRHVQQYRNVHADPRTASGFTKLWKEIVYPLVVDRSAGCRLWDIDGNEYIDLLNGFGPDLFGHSPPFVVEAVRRQFEAGYEVGPTSPLAGEVAQLICELTGMERASFVCTGSEAVAAAMRCARTVTGRNTIATFARDYHGNFDEVLVRAAGGKAQPSAPGIPPSAVANVLVLDYGTPQSLDVIRSRAHELAAVLVEPIQSRRPEWQPREFLHELRAITSASGAALIFDEVINGFRLHPGGAQAYYGVRADVATYGKVVGGGMPFGVVAGRAAFMDAFDGGTWQYGDDSEPVAGRTFFAGTFVRHPLALAAAKAVMLRLKADGPALQERLNAKADWFAGELRAICERNNVPLEVVNGGSVMYWRVLNGSKAATLLFPLIREKGVYILEGFPSYLSTAHTDADLRQIVDAFRASVAELREAGFFDGDLRAGKVGDGPVRPKAVAYASGPDRNGHHVDTYPLTEAQRELWLAAQMGDDASSAYNESCVVTFRGPLDDGRLASALNALVARHDALRSTYASDGSTFRVAPRLEVALPVVDASPTEFASLLDAEDRTAFDLARGPLLRAKLVRLADDDHRLLLTVHHIACDGWSYDILLRELGDLYSGRELPAAASFRDYARRGEPHDDDSFWLARFRDVPTPLELPTDHPRPTVRSYRGARIARSLGDELSRSVRAFARDIGVTPYTLLFATYRMLLARLSGQNDVVVGIPTAGQALEVGGPLVGHCVHFLPIRTAVAYDADIATDAKAIQATLLDAFDRQRFTYGRLVERLKLPRDAGRPPLVSASFNVDPEVKGLAFDGLDIAVAKCPKHFVNFDLHVNLVEDGANYILECEYATELFDAATVERWLSHYRTLLEGFAKRQALVGELPLLGDDERAAMARWNDSSVDFPRSAVHELFADQARRTPNAIALTFRDTTLTYAELDNRADRLAKALRARGVAEGSPVAVVAERSFDLIVGLLATLKAGGAYAPLDPTHPPQRIALLLDDLKPAAVLAPPALRDRLPPDVLALGFDATGDAVLPMATPPDAPTCVMYTSGSTGTPKGVVVPHRAIARLLYNAGYCDLGPDTVTAQLAPVAFDASTFDIWGALLHGGRCALYPERVPTPAELGEFLRAQKVNTIFLTTGLFNAVIDAEPAALAGLGTLLTGGEAVSVPHVRRALAALPDTKLVHVYGPTEATTFATYYPIPRDIPADARTLPIGGPIGNTTCHVLDPRRHDLPVGVVGELYVGGPGVADGYLNKPDATAERFVELTGGRAYRTGDLVKRRPDGLIEFVGRVDRQVKVRGFRVEPGEVEAALARAPGVKAAVVEPRRDAGGSVRLVGYFTGDADPVAVRTALLGELPEPAVPGHLVRLAELPVGPTGKIDRSRLPEPAVPPPTAERISPRDDIERRIAELWQEVLQVKEVGVSDDFFALGGHSLMAARLFGRIRDEFGRALPLAVLFRTPTIAGIAEALRGGSAPAPLLVALRSTGSRPPLFCVPGVGGHVFNYRELANRLGDDQPVYGLQPRGLDGQAAPHRTIEAMAEDYLREIRALRPKGPYHFAGYSLGGLVVIEMARQLAAAGEEIGLLAMLDAHAPGHPRRQPVAKRLAAHARNFWAKPLLSKIGYAAGRVKNLFWKKPTAVDTWLRGTAELSPEMRSVIGAQMEAMHRYRPQVYEGRVVLYRSREEEAWSEMYIPDYAMGWGEFVQGGLDLYWLPGGHLEIFQGEGLDALVTLLSQALRQR